MKRRLEPEVMDTAEDAEGYDAMDFAEPNGHFADAAIALCDGIEAPHLLDIGTGTARIPILILERHPRATIDAIDLADEMLRVATKNLDASGFGDRCRLHRLDAKALRLDQRFDLVMSNSTVHHIPEPIELFREVRRVAGDHGGILLRDLFRPPTEEAAWSIVEAAAPRDSAHQKRLFFDSLCAALTLEEVEELARSADIDGFSLRRISERHWSLERPAAPQSSPST